jgi:hypothetical protein
MTNEDLLVRWLSELNRDDADPHAVAALEAEAEAAGINLADQAKAKLAP